MANGILYDWDGVKWKNGSNYLINDRNSLISEITTTDAKWAIRGAPDVAGKADNGLYYTGTNSPFDKKYTILSEFGVEYLNRWEMTGSEQCNAINLHMNSSNICAVRGMRLPKNNETLQDQHLSRWNPCSVNNARNDGIPNYGRITASMYLSSGYHFWKSVNSDDSVSSSDEAFVRCVR